MEPLDYESATNPNQPQRGRIALRIAIGAVVEVVTLILAFLSAGAGHGNYVAAKLLFPVPMLLTIMTGKQIGPVSVMLALIQFPAFGAILAMRHPSKVPLILLLGLIHLVSALACFAGLLRNFG